MPFSSINYISIIYIFNILLIVNRGSMEKNARKNGGGGGFTVLLLPTTV
jgi:hypothetical protein